MIRHHGSDIGSRIRSSRHQQVKPTKHGAAMGDTGARSGTRRVEQESDGGAIMRPSSPGWDRGIVEKREARFGQDGIGDHHRRPATITGGKGWQDLLGAMIAQIGSSPGVARGQTKSASRKERNCARTSRATGAARACRAAAQWCDWWARRSPRSPHKQAGGRGLEKQLETLISQGVDPAADEPAARTTQCRWASRWRRPTGPNSSEGAVAHGQRPASTCDRAKRCQAEIASGPATGRAVRPLSSGSQGNRSRRTGSRTKKTRMATRHESDCEEGRAGADLARRGGAIARTSARACPRPACGEILA